MLRETKPTIGSVGLTLEKSIVLGSEGTAYFPKIGEVTVKAKDYIPEYSRVIVVDNHKGVIIYEDRVAQPGDKDDYAGLTTTGNQQEYVVGSNAHNADANVPLFEAKSISFLCTQAFLLRFNDAGRVQHTLPANVLMTFNRRTTKFYYQQLAVGGVLQVWMEG